MNKYHFLTTLFLTSLLTACGGSGGGSSKTPDNSGNSSSASSADNSGLVFDETINADWGHFSAFQWSPINNSGKNYDDGQVAGNVVQWKVIDSGATDHKSVVDVSFSSTADQSWGQFEVTPTPAKDVSAYNTGKLSFDINVQEWGDAYDQTTGAATFDVRTECGWPCSSHSNLFKITQRGVWSHIEVSVAEMINDGLDPTHLERVFIIKPMSASANGLHFHLDNIRWTKGTTKATAKKVVYAAHFNSYNDTTAWTPAPINGFETHASASIQYGFSVFPSVSNNFYNDWAFENQLATPIDINHKKVSFQIYASKQIKGVGYLEFSVIDGAGRSAQLDIQLNLLQSEVWNRISFNIDGTDYVADANFNPSDVRKIGIMFRSLYTTFNPSDSWGYTTIDEILITE